MKSIFLSCLVAMTGFFASTNCHGVLIADIAADYSELNATAGLTEAVFPGSMSGTWSVFADTDSDPLNGDLMPLVFGGLGGSSPDANLAATGFHGMGLLAEFADPNIAFNRFGYFPFISDDGVFDFVQTPPPGMVTYHPGATGVLHEVPSGGGGSQFEPQSLALGTSTQQVLATVMNSEDVPENAGVAVTRFETSVPLSNVKLEFSFSTPEADVNAGVPRGVSIDILSGNGVLLASGQTDRLNTVYSGMVPLGDLSASESFYVVMNNGPYNDPFGDQTFVSMKVIQVIPEPGTIGLLSTGWIVVVSPRWFKCPRRNSI